MRCMTLRHWINVIVCQIIYGIVQILNVMSIVVLFLIPMERMETMHVIVKLDTLGILHHPKINVLRKDYYLPLRSQTSNDHLLVSIFYILFILYTFLSILYTSLSISICSISYYFNRYYIICKNLLQLVSNIYKIDIIKENIRIT